MNKIDKISWKALPLREDVEGKIDEIIDAINTIIDILKRPKYYIPNAKDEQ